MNLSSEASDEEETSNQLVAFDESMEQDPDQDQNSNIMIEDPDGEVYETMLENNNLVYKTKYERYKKEKNELLSSNWNIICCEEKIPFAIGVEIRVKKEGHPLFRRSGIIIERVSTMKWKVNFMGTSNHVLLSRDMEAMRNPATEFNWEVVEDMEDVCAVLEYDNVGVVGFDFLQDRHKMENENGYFYKLFVHLWPGDWRYQLSQMNNEIRSKNRQCRGRKIKEVSKNEWWKFIGVIVLAGAVGKGGSFLWEKGNQYESLTEPINIGPGGLNIISKTRFDEIKEIFPTAFHDKAAQMDRDPWYPILLLLDGFNKNRKERLCSSALRVVDESMSGWKPRTSETGGLPFVSFVPRKPRSLGTEFKNVACPETGMLTYLELQRGKNPMRELKYYKEFGTTVACALRLFEGSSYGGQGNKERREAEKDKRKEQMIGDSWFSSLRLAEEMGSRRMNYVGPVSNWNSYLNTC